jgi:hypothetical protein
MDLDRLWRAADHARTKRSLASEDAAYIRDVVPLQFESFPDLDLPKSIRHPAGFSVAGAPVGTFVRSALLIAGQKALGPRFGRSAFYESVERDLAFAIMRSHFHHRYPKGTHCCAQCTLAVLPTLEARAIRYFDCRQLASEVRQLVEQRKWRFSRPPSATMERWALGA